MKTIALIALTAALPLALQAQTVGGKNIADIQSEYISVSYMPTLSASITLYIDYGQKLSFWEKELELLDESGKPMEFNSFTAAMNYLYKLGYEYIDQYTGGPPQETSLFIFRKLNKELDLANED